MYANIYIYIYVYIYIWWQSRMYSRICDARWHCRAKYIYICIYIYIHIYIYVHTCTYVCIYLHTYTYMYIYDYKAEFIRGLGSVVHGDIAVRKNRQNTQITLNEEAAQALRPTSNLSSKPCKWHSIHNKSTTFSSICDVRWHRHARKHENEHIYIRTHTYIYIFIHIYMYDYKAECNPGSVLQSDIAMLKVLGEIGQAIAKDYIHIHIHMYIFTYI